MKYLLLLILPIIVAQPKRKEEEKNRHGAALAALAILGAGVACVVVCNRNPPSSKATVEQPKEYKWQTPEGVQTRMHPYEKNQQDLEEAEKKIESTNEGSLEHWKAMIDSKAHIISRLSPLRDLVSIINHYSQKKSRYQKPDYPLGPIITKALSYVPDNFEKLLIISFAYEEGTIKHENDNYTITCLREEVAVKLGIFWNLTSAWSSNSRDQAPQPEHSEEYACKMTYIVEKWKKQ